MKAINPVHRHAKPQVWYAALASKSSVPHFRGILLGNPPTLPDCPAAGGPCVALNRVIVGN